MRSVVLAPQVSVRTWAVLHHRLRLADKPPQEAATAVLLRGLMELCIYGAAPFPPRGGRGSADSGGADDEHLPVPWSCTDDALMQVRSFCAKSLQSPDTSCYGQTNLQPLLQDLWLRCS